MKTRQDRLTIRDLQAVIASGGKVRIGGSILAGAASEPGQKKGTGTPRKSKYNAKRVQIDGIWFDSGIEGKRYNFLKTLIAAGEIKDLELQPRYDLGMPDRNGDITPAKGKDGRVLYYAADFRYKRTEDGQTVIEDVKGQDTDASRLKRAWVELLYAITIEVVTNERQEIRGSMARPERGALCTAARPPQKNRSRRKGR